MVKVRPGGKKAPKKASSCYLITWLYRQGIISHFVTIGGLTNKKLLFCKKQANAAPVLGDNWVK